MDRRHFLLAGLTGVAGCSDTFSNKASQKAGAPVPLPKVGAGGGPQKERGGKILSIYQAHLLPDNKRILTHSGDRITVWDIDRTYRYPENYIYDSNKPFDLGTVDFPATGGRFDVSVDGKQLIYVAGGIMFLRDIDTGKVIAEIETDSSSAYFGSKAGQAISLPANGRNITIWDLKTKKPIEIFAGPGLDQQAASFWPSPDRKRALMTWGERNSLTEFFLEPAADQSKQTYAIAPGVTDKRMKRGVTIQGDMHGFRGMLYVDNGNKVLTVTQHQVHQIWDITT